MAQVYFRQLSLQDPSELSGDSITTVSEETSDIAYQIRLKDYANRAQLSKTSAFKGYASGNQAIAHNTWTYVDLQSEEFDLGNNEFSDSSFTPEFSGYYKLSSTLVFRPIARPDPYNFRARFHDLTLSGYIAEMYYNCDSNNVTDVPAFSLNAIVYIVAGHQIKVRVLQNSLVQGILGPLGEYLSATVNFSGSRIA